MGHVYYHHPGDRQFSLDFVNPDPADVVSRIAGYEDDVAVKVETYDFDREFYVVYTSRAGGGKVSDMEFDPGDALARMEDDHETIVTRLLELYRSVINQNEAEENAPVTAYKDIDVGELSDALDRVPWDDSATGVAARLASNVVLKHALPNANHRTAVALVQFYLSRLDPDFSMPETAREIETDSYDWRDWVNDYINESKRVLTVRRKNVPFKYLREFGATTVERKYGVEIDLTTYELDMYPRVAMERYARKHEELWIDFVEEAVRRAGHPELIDTPGLSMSQFAERIRNLE